jgi:branched-chain amino acid transport system substrate-binding protein
VSQAVPAAVRLGVLYDFPQHDKGAAFEEALRLGLAASGGRRDRDVEIVAAHAEGLPGGTADAVEAAFAALVGDAVLAVVGPSISDNGLFVSGLADEAGVPAINYTGGEGTRSEWMFHYQVGSLEEEPLVLAAHLAGRGLKTSALVFDESPVGRRYAEWFDVGAAQHGVVVVGRAALAPMAEDATAQIAMLQGARPDALVYLGLGVGARAVAVALEAAAWDLPVAANSALMFGYARKDWRAGWQGWVYLDTVSDGNVARQRLAEASPRSAAGPVGVAAYDIGRMLGEAIAAAPHLTRAGIRDGLERVKAMPAASGLDGTRMGFGHWDHAALKGHFLVPRTWRDGRSVELGRPNPGA